MSFNPFNEKPVKTDKLYVDWKGLYVKPYDKHTVDPYTKCRIILMNGTEFEAVWHSHQFHRHENDNEIRRELALVRYGEQQQQKRLACLKPLDETILETTISYEQLAVDLTAELAQRVKDNYVKQALDFALLEDFDHLYRYADLLEADTGPHAEKLVGCYTEIMPARPTVAHHRNPVDNVKYHINNASIDWESKMAASIITAAEQQTMNYYMNVCAFYPNDLGRKLYQEIGLVEEEHVTQYGSLIDVNVGFLECNLMHEYIECFLYWSCLETETDNAIKKVWATHLDQELIHLAKAEQLLNKYANKQWQEVIMNPEFEKPLSLHQNKDYVRKILKTTVDLTGNREDYARVTDLGDNSSFQKFQRLINKDIESAPSHLVIENEIMLKGSDYRYEDSGNPLKELRDATRDNVLVGR